MSDQRMTSAAFTPAPIHWLLPCAGLVLATLAWAGNAVVGRGLRDAYDPLQLTFFRWSVATLGFYLAGHRLIRLEWPRVRPNLGRLWVGGACGMAGYHLLQYYALAMLPASEVSVIIGMTPLTVTVMEAWRRRAWPAPAIMLGIALGLAGVALVCRVAAAGAASWAGLGCAALAMLCWSWYSMRVTRCEGMATVTTLFVMSLVSTLMLLPGFAYDVAAHGMRVPDLRLGLQLLYLGIPASVAAYLLYDHGIERMGRVVGAQFNCLIPAFASALAALCLGEPLTGRQLAGLAAVVVGLNVVLLGKAREARRAGG
ncbi:hypothetical protein Bpla01_21220 [Burkholderia plantarii]|uniref:Putative drug/metabolite transporter (DMT) superfamily permease n=2 Tax=Burkholderia plantarii TaxID=41899 RepID=A0A0B6S565_BURPL|nr:putative drug/metabolite transporter (DMT) superfamily permease [Burkholderia plantarii]ALK34955.1 drug/metabolite transporter superfamily permease [Burkholderia plantarii]GLZ18592.1 hypothetical protein Bpla01_21220 [Burkholderia plantarii]